MSSDLVVGFLGGLVVGWVLHWLWWSEVSGFRQGEIDDR